MAAETATEGTPADLEQGFDEFRSTYTRLME